MIRISTKIIVHISLNYSAFCLETGMLHAYINDEVSLFRV